MTDTMQNLFEESANPAYSEILSASDYATLFVSIRKIAEGVTDENADVYLAEVNAAFSRLELAVNDKIEILSAIQDVAHSSNILYDKANEQACALIDEMEGPPPSSLRSGRHLAII